VTRGAGADNFGLSAYLSMLVEVLYQFKDHMIEALINFSSMVEKCFADRTSLLMLQAKRSMFNQVLNRSAIACGHAGHFCTIDRAVCMLKLNGLLIVEAMIVVSYASESLCTLNFLPKFIVYSSGGKG
jgi:hypothetical protein